MKKIKRLIVMLFVIFFIIFTVFFLLTGGKRPDVFLKDYDVSSDGKTITLKVGVSSSAGYIRRIKKTSGSTNGYYTFYSTYGINSKIGAKDTFEIEVDKDTDEIYFYTGDNGYKLVLARWHPTGEWEKINYADMGKIRINMPNKDKIIKFAINTMTQDNNYFSYSDKDIIDRIYNIFDGLETITPSTTVNPEESNEIYDISFDTAEYEDIVEWHVSVYKRNEKYYVEQRYNGIYEISEEDFNLFKNYIK